MPYSYASDAEAKGPFDAQAQRQSHSDVVNGDLNRTVENGRAQEMSGPEKDDYSSADVQAEYLSSNGNAEQTIGSHVNENGRRDADNTGKRSGYSKEDGVGNGVSNSSPMKYDPAYEVKWDDDENKRDPSNPYNMGGARKWIIMFVVSMSAFCVTCTSSIYASTYDQITVEFNVSRIVATLGLSLFVVGLGLGPLFLSPLSEFYGRRPIYIYSYAAFVIWMIPCAVAGNVETILISRFLKGLSGSAFLSVAGGTVRDLFVGEELSLPMSLYTGSTFLGPVFGPLFGGYINQFTTWRWTFYFLLIWSGTQLALIYLLVPETYHAVLLRTKAQRLRKETGKPGWHAPIEKMSRSVSKTVLWSCIRPFQLLFFEPMCLNLCILTALLLGILYLSFGAFPLVFANNHGFSLSQTGLSFLGILVGMAIGIASDPLWRRKYAALVHQNEAERGEHAAPEPEFRLPPAVWGAWLVPIGLFGFGWTTFSSIHWIVPIILSAIFGIGNIWVFSGVFNFLVDCYPMYAASALAANSFARSAFAAAFPLFSVQMYNNLGYQWATSLLAFISLAMAPFPYIFFKYGKRLRGTSSYHYSMALATLPWFAAVLAFAHCYSRHAN